MPNPAWFNEDYFLAQKAAQMNAINWNGKSDWTAAEAGQQIAAFPTTAFDNFTACNTSGYQGISAAQINVSPNALFDVGVYAQNLANYANANNYQNRTDWTMDNVLDHMLNDYHSSAWEHYTAIGQTYGINPSNDFDVQTWLATQVRPGQTVDQLLAQYVSQGTNPVMEFFNAGGTVETAPKVGADGQVTLPAGWNPWGEGGSTPADDPYDQNFVDVAIEKGNTGPYEGEANQNTHFTAVWDSINAATVNTLAAGDVINGGSGALNSLVVNFGKDWTGFNGIKVDGQFNPDPSVTNIGRIVLNHSEGTAERNWTFDAKNISSDTVRYDLNNVGTGTISLKNLNDAVETVNISGIKGVSSDTDGAALQAQDVQLDFAMGANTGKADAITLGVAGVCTEGGVANIKGLTGIEDITVNATGDASTINLAGAAQATSIKVTGDADLTIYNSAVGVKTYDASAATGNINFGANDFGKDTVIGGSGNDTVTYQGSASGKANWTSIEYVALMQGGKVNVANVTGLEQLWVSGEDTDNELNHLNADSFTVYQAKDDVKSILVNANGGNLQDITWIGVGTTEPKEPNTIQGKLVTDASGNVTLQVTEQGMLGDSNFSAKYAKGTVTLNTPNANTADTAPAVTLAADAATAFVANVVGAMTINGADAKSTQNMQDVTITLENANDDGNDKFQLLSDLTAAQNIKIEGGEEDVKFDNIGDLDTGVGVTLNAANVNTFEAGAISGYIGANINVTIDAASVVTLGAISSKTNKLGNSEGDVTLNITASAESGNAVEVGAVNADDIFINLSNVDGDAEFTGSLAADGNIQYQGASGVDKLEIANLGVGSTSQISLDAGADELTITATSLLSKGKATLMIDGGADSDTVTIDGTPANGFVTVYLSDVEKVDGDFVANVEFINLALKGAGVGVTLEEGATPEAGNWYAWGDSYLAVATTDGTAGMILMSDELPSA